MAIPHRATFTMPDRSPTLRTPIQKPDRGPIRKPERKMARVEIPPQTR